MAFTPLEVIGHKTHYFILFQLEIRNQDRKFDNYECMKMLKNWEKVYNSESKLHQATSSLNQT